MAKILCFLLLTVYALPASSCPSSSAKADTLETIVQESNPPVRKKTSNTEFPVCSDFPLRTFLSIASSSQETEDNDDLFLGEYPSLQPQSLTSSEEAMTERILAAAEELQGQSWIPYVWGGHKLGTENECKKCQECVIKKKVKPERRLQRCAACRNCGIDCSHFVAQVFRKADLPLKYGTTHEWKKLSADELLQQYQLRDLGKNIEDARPADILLYDGHVVMLVELTGPGIGTIIHATRRGKVSGGIRVNTDVDLARFHGPLRKILRHQELTDMKSQEGQPDPFLM